MALWIIPTIKDLRTFFFDSGLPDKEHIVIVIHSYCVKNAWFFHTNDSSALMWVLIIIIFVPKLYIDYYYLLYYSTV